MSAPESVVHEALRRLTRKRRRVAAVRVLIAGLAMTGLWVLLAVHADRWIHTRRTIRVAAEAVSAVLLLWTFFRAIRLLVSRSYDPIRAARHAEAADASWGERLTTVVTQLHLPPADRGSAHMNAALLQRVAVELDQRPPARRARLSAARPALSLMGFVLACWLATMLVPSMELPRLLERHLLPFAEVPPVTGTQIDLLRHPLTLAQGHSLSIVADLNRDAGAVELNVGPDLQHLQPLAMKQIYALRYTITLLSPPEDFVYRVTAGDAVTAPVWVKVLRTPGATLVSTELQFPDGRPPQKLSQNEGDLHVPAGTRVTVRFTTTDPVQSAAVRVGNTTVAASPVGDNKNWRATFVAETSGPWSIELVGDHDVHGSGPEGMQLRVD